MLRTAPVSLSLAVTQAQMPATLELRWEFTPETLFEDRLTCDLAECKITVDQGVVVASLPLIDGETKSALREAVESFVESLFLGVQIVAHMQCQLSGPSVSTLQDDGSRGYIIECEPGTIQIRGGRVDIRYVRSDGTVVDTRRDRVERKHRLSRAAAIYAPSDEALARMLRSYRSAIADAEDELIHLYEVLDTLASTFRSQTEALRQLGQPKRKWGVGSRTGAVTRRIALVCIQGFPLRARVGCSVVPFPAPATSHAACGFPALRAPAHFLSRVMGPILLALLWPKLSDAIPGTD